MLIKMFAAQLEKGEFDGALYRMVLAQKKFSLTAAIVERGGKLNVYQN